MHSIRTPLRRTLAVSAALAAAGVLASCAGPAPAASTNHIPMAPAAQRLDDVCPSTVVVQATWEPEVDHAAFYQLVGPDASIDTRKKSVTGSLVDDGEDTGVKIEVRSGGSAIGYQPVISQMYADTSITLGSVPTEDRVAGAADQPAVGVFATRQISPLMLQWDPATHPSWKSIADIGTSNASVVVSKGALYAQVLAAQGVLKKSQIEDSYDGAPARFVSDPSIAQEGFVTSELYIYEHEVTAWDRPIRYQLVKDAGYDVYPDALSVRSGELDKLRPCLKKLVPALQRSTLAYLQDPSTTNALIVKLAHDYDTGWVYSARVAEAGTAVTKKLKLMTGTDPSVPVGDFAQKRAQKSLDLVTKAFAEGGTPVKAGLSVRDVFDDEFIDRSITG